MTERAQGFYWILAQDEPWQVAQWSARWREWAICGSDESLGDDELRIRAIVGPLEAPRPDHVPTGNPAPPETTE